MQKGKNWIVIPILNVDYEVLVCWGTDAEVRRVLARFDYSDAYFERRRGDRGLSLLYERAGPVVCLPCAPVTANQIGILAHEAHHAVDNIWQSIGERSYDEAFAHSVGAVVREVLLHVRALGRKTVDKKPGRRIK